MCDTFRAGGGGGGGGGSGVGRRVAVVVLVVEAGGGQVVHLAVEALVAAQLGAAPHRLSVIGERQPDALVIILLLILILILIDIDFFCYYSLD